MNPYQDQEKLDTLDRAIKVLVDRMTLLDERTKRSNSIAYMLEASGRMAELARAVDQLMERQKAIKNDSETGGEK